MALFISEEQQLLKSYLNNDERLLWWGMPKQGVIFSKFDFLLIPFSILWGGFAIVWEALAIYSGAPWYFILFGIPFVLAGLYLMVGRFYYDKLRRKNTIYGLTKSRIIFLTGTNEKKASYISIDEIKYSYMQEKPDGSGTIFLFDVEPEVIFNQPKNISKPARQSGGKAANKIPPLEMIADAQNVYSKITHLQNSQNRQ